MSFFRTLNKKQTFAVMGTAALLLAGCGNNGGANNEADASAATPSAQVTASAPAGSTSPSASPAGPVEAGISADELIAKVTEATAGLKSYAMETSTIQNMDFSQNGESQQQEIEMDTQTEFTRSPMRMHQTVTSNMTGQEQTFEQYITDKEMYIQANGQWQKMPLDETLKTAMTQSVNPEQQLNQFKSFAKEIKVFEKDGAYTMDVQVSGDKVKDIAKGYLGQSNQQQAQMLDQMNIKSMTLSYTVDKKTYYPVATDMIMAMDMDAEGQTVKLDMTVSAQLSDHNGIDEIKVPQEALNAQEVQSGTGQ
ncbi:DUF6612 family protein [Paenibacillus spiritus]|nr:DUF6612 family protein [Paenibacillus spiritus]